MQRKFATAGAFVKTRLQEASTYAGLAFLLYTGDRSAVALAVLCALAAILLPETRK